MKRRDRGYLASASLASWGVFTLLVLVHGDSTDPWTKVVTVAWLLTAFIASIAYIRA